MGDVVADLAASDLNVTPVMVTVDPSRDTVETIGTPLKKHHPDFVGLTGSADDLQKVYDLYSVENKVVFTDPELGDIFAHGSHLYLLDAKGKFLTLLPPILSAERIAELVQKYAKGES
jgi:protein SCO1/2